MYFIKTFETQVHKFVLELLEVKSTLKGKYELYDQVKACEFTILFFHSTDNPEKKFSPYL